MHVIFSIFLLSFCVGAQDRVVPEMEPILAARGPLLFSDDFSASEINPAWQVVHGRYEIVGGALKGVELAVEKHSASIRHALEYRDAIFQFSFMLDGARQISLMMTNQGGHVGRVMIRPNGFVLMWERPNPKSTAQSATLTTVNTPFEIGRWYTMLLEIQGKRITARVDDQHVATGEHTGLDVDKKFFGLPVAGDGASFDNVRVWKAVSKAGPQ